MEFKDYVSNDLLEDLTKNNIIKPTKVQEKTIPLLFQKKDVIVQSETGSGKTLAFAVPTIQNIQKEGKVHVLAILPTRELAKQVAEEYKKFSKSKGLETAVVYGGVSINNQIYDVRTADIVVGTPGRLLDLLNRNTLDLRNVKYLIIDEADRLLEMGFIDDVNAIVRYLPRQRQSMMFSATINKLVLRLAYKYLNNPEKILLENTIEKNILKQYYYNVKEYDKISLLVHLLKEIKEGLSLVFCNTKRTSRFVAEMLKRNGVSAECLNGDMTQFMREKVMEDFTKDKINVLVATDVAARGLHIENIACVFNYDLHENVEMYIHRIGRTARNGNTGTAIILLSEKDYRLMDRIMNEYRDFIEKKEAVNFERIKMPERTRDFRNDNRRNNRSFFSNRRRYQGIEA